MSSRGLKDALKILTVALLPGGRFILRALGTSVMKSNETMFFFDLVKAAVEIRWDLRGILSCLFLNLRLFSRKKTKERRNDLIDLMIDVMKNELNEEIEQDNDQYDMDAKFSHR